VETGEIQPGFNFVRPLWFDLWFAWLLEKKPFVSINQNYKFSFCFDVVGLRKKG